MLANRIVAAEAATVSEGLPTTSRRLTQRASTTLRSTTRCRVWLSP